MVWSCSKNSKPKNTKTNCNSCYGRNYEKRKTKEKIQEKVQGDLNGVNKHTMAIDRLEWRNPESEANVHNAMQRLKKRRNKIWNCINEHIFRSKTPPYIQIIFYPGLEPDHFNSPTKHSVLQTSRTRFWTHNRPGRVDNPETSVLNHPTLRNIPEDGRIQVQKNCTVVQNH